MSEIVPIQGERSLSQGRDRKVQVRPIVSVIIAAHNGSSRLGPCLQSVYRQDYTDFEVIFVDNASTDDSVALVRSEFPQVHLIECSANLGYGGGNNRGASIARGQLLLFLNDDTIVSEDFLTELVKAVESDPSIGMAQSKILTAADPTIVETVGAYLTRTGMWIHERRWERDDRELGYVLDVMAACGTCLLVRRVVFDRLGGFDDDFLVYYDDADLSWRAWLAGYRVVCATRSAIRHWGSGTTRALPSTFTVYHSFKNRLCSLIKLLPVRDLILIVPVHLVLCVAGVFAYLLRLKPANSWAIIRALIWNVRNITGTLEKRAEVQGVQSQDRSDRYRSLIRSLPLGYFVRTSMGYVAKW